MAHWIIDDHGFGGQYYRCSECGDSWCDIYDDHLSEDNCPSCGASIIHDETEYIEKKKKLTAKLMSDEQLNDYIKREVMINTMSNIFVKKRKRMLEHNLTYYIVDDKTIVTSWIQLNIFGKCFHFSKKTITIDNHA